MPTQNVLVEDYKKLQLQFVICDSCYWCATCFSYNPNRCPSCGSSLNAMPLPQSARCSE
ncbi:MAG: hypothetical protein ACREAW_01475 [Nitrososphaera sp.]